MLLKSLQIYSVFIVLPHLNVSDNQLISNMDKNHIHVAGVFALIWTNLWVELDSEDIVSQVGLWLWIYSMSLKLNFLVFTTKYSQFLSHTTLLHLLPSWCLCIS